MSVENNIGDRLALRALVDGYAHGVDRRDRAALLALFTAGAELVQPSGLVRAGADATVAGGEAIADTVLASVAHLYATRHVVSQQTLHLSGDTAVGETYCAAHHIYAKADAYRDYCLAIRYQDEFARSDGRWSITRRELVVDWFCDRAVSLLSG